MAHSFPIIPIHGPEDGGGPSGPQRRRVLQLMAASAALATGACTQAPDHRIYPYVHMPEAGVGGLPVYYASAWVRDGFAHGVLVGTREGRPVKIEGNPLHPASGGATDVFAQASVLELWDPDRSQAVQARLPGVQAAPFASRATPAAPPSSISTWDAFSAAWRQRAQQLRAGQGGGLHVLVGPSTSPTLQGQLAALQLTFPRMRLYLHAPLAPVAAIQAAQHTFGRPVHLVRHLDRARVVVALGSDPFSQGPAALAQAADWARQRAADLAAGRPPCRLMAVETAPGLFGARADDRLALAPAGIEALLARVAAQLFPDLGPAPAGGDPAPAFEAALAAQLRVAGPDSLLVPGDDLAPAAHALVHALHQRLGAFGRTLHAIVPPDAAPDGVEQGTLADLADALHGGQVSTLLLLDANPAYDAPGALRLARGIAQVPFSIHLGVYRDETGRACTWHLPASHGYEAWSDARAFDGTASILQPAIAPLYDTRSAHELLALLQDDGLRDGHALVQRRWKLEHGGADFEAFWHTSLRDGVVAGTAAPALALPRVMAPVGAATANAVPAKVDAAPGAVLAAVFGADASTACGRFANSGWLQELPRPFSKMTWDNAATLGPRTAAALGVVTGDVVRIGASGAAVSAASTGIEAPVWVEALHAEGTVSLPLGYGRRNAGRVGSGVGFDAYVLRPVAGGPLAVTLHATGAHHDFAVTQHRMEQEGRELARTVPLATPRVETPPERASLYAPRPYPDHAWAMTIDLDACIGCNACTIACQSENNIPVVGAEQVAAGREMHWIRVDRYDDAGTHQTVFQPVPCMHCENAPCEVVCPVGATVHDSEGLNVQVYNRCIGTRFCSNNCPYKVRRFNFLQYSDEVTETAKAQRNPEVTVRRRGVMEKCTFCVQRVSKARLMSEKEDRPLADGDVRTACQSACPTQAIRFGDLNLAGSGVVQSRQSPRHYAMLEELNTRPRTTYLAKVVVDPPPTEPKA